MVENAYRKRLTRAKNHARRNLLARNFLVFDLKDPDYSASMVAIDPDSSKAKIVRVCLPETDIKRLGKIKHLGDVKLEIWYRDPRKYGFRVINP